MYKRFQKRKSADKPKKVFDLWVRLVLEKIF